MRVYHFFTTANQEILVTISPTLEVLVKNLTDDDIWVFVNGAENKIVIPSECSQIVVINKMVPHHTDDLITEMKILPFSTSTRGVEVQCLKW